MLRIEAPGADRRKLQDVEGGDVDGSAQANVWLDSSRMREGVDIAFRLHDGTPAAGGWGTSPSSLPSSPCAVSH